MAIDADLETNLAFAEFTLDRADERLLGPNGPIKLGNKAYRVLLMLAENEGRLLTKDSLFSSVWDGTIVSESALTSVIKELRHALGDQRQTPRFIESVYGRGYRFMAQVSAAPARGNASPVMEAPSRFVSEGRPPLILVTAFEDGAVHANHPHCGATLREEVLLGLARFSEIQLVAYDHSTGEAPAAHGMVSARDYQLTATLLPEGEGVKVIARLRRLADGRIIWADTMPLADTGIADGVETIVRRIAVAALPRMQDDLLYNLPAQPHDAYDLYFLTKLRMRDMASLDEARDVAATWEQLIEAHPNFTLAYPPLVRLYDTDYCYLGLGSTSDKERERARDLAYKACAINPADSHLHTVKGWTHIWAGEWALARQHLQQALRLNPYNERTLVEVATALMYLDDLDEADDLLDRCRDLTPLDTQAPFEEKGLLHLLRGEYELAAEQFSLVHQRHPEDPAGTKPGVISELFPLLAAAGADTADLPARARHWRRSIEERWCGAEPLTNERLKEWILYQNPFHSPGRRAWLMDLMDRAMAAETGAAAAALVDDSTVAARPSLA